MDILAQVISIVIPVLIGFLAYLIRGHLERIQKIEDKIEKYVTEGEVHQIVNDKLAPVREDIAEIKQTLTKLYDFLLSK